MDCIFCKIAAGKLPANIVYQDEEIVAFDDLYPKAPIHKLIIPRKHIATVNDLEHGDESLLGRMLIVTKQLAKELAIAQKGYRISINCNSDGGQEVYHLHLHLLGGHKLYWPLG